MSRSSLRRRAVVVVAAALCAVSGMNAHGAEGVKPAGPDGRPLNLDFEDGTLRDWTATGEAFAGQPIKGNTVNGRNGFQSEHAGQYWLGGYEKVGDDPKGTLTSVPFKVTHPWCSFLFNGGSWAETRVELVRADTGAVFFKSSGTERENMRTAVVDLKDVRGKEIFVRLVDERSGHWGHVNFDEFLFHDERPNVPQDRRLIPPPPPPPADEVKYAGLSPEKAVEAMTLPAGFKATVFAAEPDIVQPIAFTIDARGRLWVVEGLTYPIRAKEGQGKDRILIFEDTDNDGKHDKKTVFAEGLNLVSGIEVGFGGVYVGAAPYLLFIPDKNADDKPDGEPQVLLDGWGYQDTHETLNSFIWGPDGWLYGAHGVFTHSKVGKPGTPDEQRTKINAGVWRYHPTRHEFEVFAEGTSNPWGMDFDENGQLWAEACVIPHLWHIIPGARYQRQAGQHFNPYTFDDIKQTADHVHYAGDKGPHAGNGRSDSAGGGHAHAGLMVYQGNNWPAEYRGRIFIGNIHGQRINMDVPEAKGSGYVGRHGADFINFNDRWSQIINFKSGPDGGVYFIDWYDAQQCHVPNPAAHDRGNGRIFKVTYGEPKPGPADDLSKLNGFELLDLLNSRNAWHGRTALRLLQERGPRVDTGEFGASLIGMGQRADDTAVRLRAIAALHADGRLHPTYAKEFLSNPNPHVVAWTIRLLAEGRQLSPELSKELVRLADEAKSPIVRLSIVSAMLRLPADQRWDVLKNLVSHSEDADDHNLPLMYWYAAEPLADVDASRALPLALDAKTPNLLTFMSRKLAMLKDGTGLPPVVAALDKLDEADARRVQMLKGMADAIGGQGRQVAMPQGWPALEAKLSASGDGTIRSLTQTLAVTFGSKAALGQMRKTLADAAAPEAQRKAALDTLVAAKDIDALPLLQSLLTDAALRGPAVRGLAAFDDAKTPGLIVDVYGSLPQNDKRDAINTLASRPAWAAALLDAVDGTKIAGADVTADLVRQLRNLGDKAIDARLDKAFATTRKTPEEKLRQIAAAKTMLTAGPAGDAARGRLVYNKTCAQCHTLFDAGGAVGPNITGANRADLDYLLLNILDPNAVIPAEYRTTIVRTKDGRVLTGILKKQDENAITLTAATETVVIQRKDIDRMKDQEISMMPEGLFDGLKEDERRDLIGYLQSPRQVPAAAAAK